MKVLLIICSLLIAIGGTSQIESMEILSKTSEYNELKSLNLDRNNWLFYFRDDYRLTNKSHFIIEMDIQLKPQFVDALSLDINRDKVFLFIEPIENQIVNENMDGKKCVKVYSAKLITQTSHEIDCSFYWYSNSMDDYVDTSEKMENSKDLIFKLDFIDKTNLKYVPAKVAGEERYLYRYNFSTYFPILTSSENLMAENFMIFELRDETELEKIKQLIIERE